MPKSLEVIQLLRESRKIADAVVIAVIKGAHVQLVDDGVFIP